MQKIVLVFLGIIWASFPALAAESPVLLGTFGDWKAYRFHDGRGQVCFMSSQPQKQEGKFTKRGEVFLFVTHSAADGTKDVVSVSAGYPYKENVDVTLKANGRSFALFTQGETAWAREKSADAAISEAIRKGATLTVKGTSKRGTLTTDTYSLKGSGDAYKAISKECGF